MRADNLGLILILLSASHVTGDNHASHHENPEGDPELSTETSRVTETVTESEPTASTETEETATPTMNDFVPPVPVVPTLKEHFNTFVETIKNVSEKIKEAVTPPVTKPVRKRSAPKFEENSTTNCQSQNLPCPKSGFYRFNRSCTKFYECYFSPKCNKFVSRVRSCPKCLKFNARKMGCDFAEDVPECTYPGENKTCTGPGLFPVPGDCHSYYDCTNATLIVRPCPPGTAFSQKERKCVPRKNCKAEKVAECASGLSYAADKFSCSKFHFCLVGNVTVAWGCPKGHIFENGFCETLEKSKLNWEKIKKRLVKKRG